MNKIIEQCLRAFVHRRPRVWGKLLLWVEWSHNTSWNAATGSTPYEITFGRKPFNFPDYITGTSKLDAVEDMLKDRDETFQCIRKKLLKAQANMKKFTDMKRREMRSTPADPWQVLVQWKWLTPDDTSWEDWDTLQQDYHLEDKVILQGPPSDSIVMSKVQIADKGAEQTEQYEGEVRIASDTKRKVSRPKYLKDYV
ncbi:Transposon Tf2-9 polyprotein [Glycine max]|nr:Transposon Tf2-9 polyprotein [Glycine max]